MNVFATIIFGFLGVCVTALGAYFIARRQTSGTVATTDAAKLWDEATLIRKDAVERAAELQKKLDAVRKENNDMRIKFAEMEGQLKLLTAQNAAQAQAIAKLQVQQEEGHDGAK